VKSNGIILGDDLQFPEVRLGVTDRFKDNYSHAEFQIDTWQWWIPANKIPPLIERPLVEIIPVISADYTAKIAGDEVFVNLGEKQGLKMDRMGFAILEMCNGNDSISTIVRTLSGRFDTDTIEVESDVMDTLDFLSRKGIVHFVRVRNGNIEWEPVMNCQIFGAT